MSYAETFNLSIVNGRVVKEKLKHYYQDWQEKEIEECRFEIKRCVSSEDLVLKLTIPKDCVDVEYTLSIDQETFQEMVSNIFRKWKKQYSKKYKDHRIFRKDNKYYGRGSLGVKK